MAMSETSVEKKKKKTDLEYFLQPKIVFIIEREKKEKRKPFEIESQIESTLFYQDVYVYYESFWFKEN